MPTRNSLRLGAALCGALLLAGCANQLPQRSEHEERVERTLLSHNLQIELGEPAMLELPQRHIRIHDQRTFEIREFEVIRRYDRYTPYQPWRELYEVPLGAVAVLAGVAANVLNVVALGNVPDLATKGWIDYGFAGLNPAMNVESNGRAQQNLARRDEQLKDERTEYSSLPWAERPVSVRAGARTYELTTDRRGVLHLNLLDSPFTLQDARVARLQLSVEDLQDGTRTEAVLPISRSLGGKLREAHDLVYADLESDEVGQWVRRVKRLAELGFEEEASELEQSLIELTRHDPELQREFLDDLRRKAGRQALVPAED
ncbi:hypothetical protein AvCA_36760 [Azotobacter vinelandii CA]|uniref:Lipoprotein n=2 Tax=Azotobacter vinelandii TaxID=354 RepID=C1DRG5_AZOVD|nr:hypothetical protein [Azotobacter vinelandii]ACO79823.1 conserved hypothetical protein [Azotobacter vinelandii DJ]AGK14557.1 hypothetical protein AvCA_36760 [Azotobacter vinelandii CA]AGK21530.1 hypothetical protein AvCA6_36760 [Azotobacter vinelandii CA6]WKN20609.1 hypothetical protein AVAEIV_003613 [Azotobacter vinelandii]SFX43212.1 hypothetical protein SAMN04244547_01539 [Azotobacter vinelandii]